MWGKSASQLLTVSHTLIALGHLIIGEKGEPMALSFLIFDFRFPATEDVVTTAIAKRYRIPNNVL